MRPVGVMLPYLESATSSFPFTPGAAIDVPESVSVAVSVVLHYMNVINGGLFVISKSSQRKERQRRGPTLVAIDILTQGRWRQLTDEFGSVVRETSLVAFRVNSPYCHSALYSSRARVLCWRVGIA